MRVRLIWRGGMGLGLGARRRMCCVTCREKGVRTCLVCIFGLPVECILVSVCVLICSMRLVRYWYIDICSI